MPRRRRGNSNRNDRQDGSPETSGPQGTTAPSENTPGPENPSGQGNRPQRPDSQPRRGMFPREISPAEVNERLNQRRTNRPGGAPAKDDAAAQSNNALRRRRGGPPGQGQGQGKANQRRNPANRNAPNRNQRSDAPRNTNTDGQNEAGNRPARTNPPRGNSPRGNPARGITSSGKLAREIKTGSAARKGVYVQRSRSMERPAPSVPIRTNKGIKARNQRGQFSQHWWARRWIEAMEGLVDQARLQRGRSYARSGQVLSIIETQNGIEAKVQGSRPKPYEVTIQVTPLNDRQWDLVIDALSEQALFTAQLLAGEMPGNIEDAFKTAGVSLFPSQTGDLFSDCTCPDWANPCKHVAATHYILGDRFDDDPFLLFRMRGRTQEEILEALRHRRAEAGEAEPVAEEPLIEAEKVTPLEEQMDHFWEPVESLEKLPLTIKLASVDMPLFKRMGEPAFMGGESLQALLKPFYDTFTRSALRAAYSEEEPVESNNGQEEQE